MSKDEARQLLAAIDTSKVRRVPAGETSGRFMRDREPRKPCGSALLTMPTEPALWRPARRVYPWR